MIPYSQVPMNFPDRCVGQAFPWHYQFEWLISGCYKGLLKIFFHLYSLYRWVVKVAVEVAHMEHLCGKRKYPNFYWFVDGRNCWNHWEICFGGAQRRDGEMCEALARTTHPCEGWETTVCACPHRRGSHTAELLHALRGSLFSFYTKDIKAKTLLYLNFPPVSAWLVGKETERGRDWGRDCTAS